MRTATFGINIFRAHLWNWLTIGVTFVQTWGDCWTLIKNYLSKPGHCSLCQWFWFELCVDVRRCIIHLCPILILNLCDTYRISSLQWKSGFGMQRFLWRYDKHAQHIRWWKHSSGLLWFVMVISSVILGYDKCVHILQDPCTTEVKFGRMWHFSVGHNVTTNHYLSCSCSFFNWRPLPLTEKRSTKSIRFYEFYENFDRINHLLTTSRVYDIFSSLAITNDESSLMVLPPIPGLSSLGRTHTITTGI